MSDPEHFVYNFLIKIRQICDNSHMYMRMLKINVVFVISLI